MSSASTLSDSEVSLILGMLDLRPRLTKQAILAHFTRPGRDINNRLITEIENGQFRPGVAPAAAADVAAFMAAAGQMPQLAPERFVGRGTGPRRHARLDWWPVGQGLFASGAIVGGSGAALTWVYDCGTASSDALLDRALADFATEQARIGAARIRLCVLSHFDRDHVSGVERLLDCSPVETLLLPYIPLWRRLVIALEEGVGPDDPLMEFFLDPVAYLTGGRDGRIGEVVFVPPSGPDGPAPFAPEDLDGDPEGRAPDLKVERGEPPEEAADDPVLALRAGVSVSFLRRAGRLYAPMLWEFVPYNDAGLAPNATPAFLAAAGRLITTLLTRPTERASALKDLGLLYDHHFGPTPKLRNLISLFLYSGPVGQLRLERGPLWAFSPGVRWIMDRFSQMHTGDGTLDEGRRYDEFAQFYRAGGRLERSAVFQVMHHGARGNWHEGIAAKLAPAVSIFSSDPTFRRPGHPHAEVLRDFWPYGATQVDGQQRYRLQGWLVR